MTPNQWSFKRLLGISLLLGLPLAGCHATDQSGAIHLGKAKAAFAAHDLASAETEVAASIKADPRSRDAHFLAGQIDQALGHTQAAFADFTRADMIDALDRRARVETIAILVEAGELGAATGRISTLLADDPQNADALALRAFVEQQQRGADKARRDAQAVLTHVPDHPVASAVLAGLATDGNDPETAQSILDRAMLAHPGNPWLLQAKSAAFAKQRQFGKAASTYGEIVATRPGSARARLAQAELQGADDHLAGGEATLRAGVAAVPDNREMRLALFDFLLRHGMAAAANDVLRDGIKNAPDTSLYDMTLASALERSGQAGEAERVVRSALARLQDGPARTATRIGLARLEITRGDFRAARADLDDVVRTSPDNDGALLLRSEIMAPNEAGQAVKDLLTVASRHPTDPQPIERLASAYVSLGRTDDALAAAKRLSDLHPTDFAASARFAGLALSLGKPAEGQAAIDDYATRNPDSVRGRIDAVLFATLEKNWPAAEAALDRLRSQPGTETIAAELAGAVKERQGKPAEAAALYRPLVDKGVTSAASAYGRAAFASGQGADALAVLATQREHASGEQAGALDGVIAALQSATGQAAAAAASYEAAIRSAPKDPAGYIAKAASLTRQAQPGQALTTLETGLAAGAARPPMLLAKAAIQQATGDLDGASSTYKTILDDDPNALVAANNRASFLADRKPLDRPELASARDALRRFLAAGNPSLLDTAGWAAYRLGDLADAKDLLERARAGTSSSPDLRFHYGAVLIASGDRSAGEALVRSVLDKDFAGRSEAKALVEN